MIVDIPASDCEPILTRLIDVLQKKLLRSSNDPSF
jgi:hypothetical protein